MDELLLKASNNKASMTIPLKLLNLICLSFS